MERVDVFVIGGGGTGSDIAYALAGAGLTVVMATHDLDSLFAICDRVAVLVDKKLRIGTLAEHLRDPHPWIQAYFHGPRGRAAQAGGQLPPPADPALAAGLGHSVPS